MSITIAELISNGTMSAEVAATLWAEVDGQRSFLSVVIPRFAGKSTISNAVLAELTNEALGAAQDMGRTALADRARALQLQLQSGGRTKT